MNTAEAASPLTPSAIARFDESVGGVGAGLDQNVLRSKELFELLADLIYAAFTVTLRRRPPGGEPGLLVGETQDRLRVEARGIRRWTRPKFAR